MIFKDPFNPTKNELILWANSSEFPPIEDFDLMVANKDNAEVILELASNTELANYHYFFRYLFTLTEELCRNNKDFLSQFILKNKNSTKEHIRQWAAFAEEYNLVADFTHHICNGVEANKILRDLGLRWKRD